MTHDGLFNNPEMPSLNAWIVTQWEADVQAIWERNPYYYAVDTEGNQLPYIDGIDETKYADTPTRLHKIMEGSVDFLSFTDMTMGDVAPVKEAEEAGGYEVRFWDTGSGTGMMYFWNHDAKDPMKRELYRNPKFKQAISFAMDRPTIQKSVYFDTGMITTGSMSPKAIEFNYNDAARSIIRSSISVLDLILRRPKRCWMRSMLGFE
jgi:peptide/nickel transport system substrate-binding protein